VDFIAIVAIAATGWVVGATAIALVVGRSIKIRDQSDLGVSAQPVLSRRR
jgi:membrane protein DedA with SNARE-associated domain